MPPDPIPSFGLSSSIMRANGLGFLDMAFGRVEGIVPARQFVMSVFAWPSRCATTFTRTPAFSAKVALYVRGGVSAPGLEALYHDIIEARAAEPSDSRIWDCLERLGQEMLVLRLQCETEQSRVGDCIIQ